MAGAKVNDLAREFQADGVSFNNPRSFKTLVTFWESSTVNPMRQKPLRKDAINIRSRLGLAKYSGTMSENRLNPIAANSRQKVTAA